MKKLQRLKILLQKGYFPEELPPPFQTDDLAKYARALSRRWLSLSKPPNTRYQRYSIPRVEEGRRNLGITNPVSQFYLSLYIANNWIEIQKFIRKSNYSISVPEIVDDMDRSILTTDFEKLRNKRFQISAENNDLFISDISRFYPTLYTHVIPWAMHGKAWCKANLNSRKYHDLVGTNLDRLVRETQEGQTIGIPIGPDTSRIISEVVAVGVENRFLEIVQEAPLGVRHIDDIILGANGLSDAEFYRSSFERALDYYELQINIDKTKIVDSAHFMDDLWVHELAEFRFGKSQKKQYRDIIHYFHLSFDKAARNPKSNVIRYAINKTKGLNVFPENWSIYEIFLIKSARANATCLADIVQILADYNWRGFSINKPLIKKFIVDIIIDKSPLGHHGEVSWALFLAKALKIVLDRKCFEPLYEINCSTCRLLALDLESLGLGVLDKSKWTSMLTTDNLNSELWLFAYEAELKGWLTPANRNFIKEHALFKDIRALKISFYDTRRNVKKIKSSRSKKDIPPLQDIEFGFPISESSSH